MAEESVASREASATTPNALAVWLETHTQKLRRAYIWLRILPLVLFGAFHLFELWTVFRGFRAFVPRITRTGFGVIPLLFEIAFFVLPLTLWTALFVLRLQKRIAVTDVDVQNNVRFHQLLRGVFAQERLAETITLAFLWLHLGHFWFPKVAGGANAFELYSRMFSDLGTPVMLAGYAIALSAMLLHIVNGIVRATYDAVYGDLSAPPNPGDDAPVMWLGIAIACAYFALFAQVAGFVGTGHGTFWSVHVTPLTGTSVPQ